MAIYRAHRADWEASLGSASTRPKKRKGAAPAPITVEVSNEHVPRRMAGKRRSLNLAATLRHAQPSADSSELVVHTSESASVAKPAPKPTVKIGRTSEPGPSRGSKPPRPAKAGMASDSAASRSGEWWNSAPA